MKATWINKDVHRITVEAPDKDMKKFKKKVDYYNRTKRKAKYILKTIMLIGLFSFTSCTQYQVVQELNVNLYHLHNPKTKEIEIIVTKDKLKIGEWYRLKNINIIEIDKHK